LEPKDAMKKRLSKMGMDSASPDDGDALALTFAAPVRKREEDRDSGPAPHVGVWS
jgi:hypothetical protein